MHLFKWETCTQRFLQNDKYYGFDFIKHLCNYISTLLGIKKMHTHCGKNVSPCWLVQVAFGFVWLHQQVPTKWQKHVSHNSGIWKSESRVPAQVGSWERTPSAFQTAVLSSCLHVRESIVCFSLRRTPSRWGLPGVICLIAPQRPQIHPIWLHPMDGLERATTPEEAGFLLLLFCLSLTPGDVNLAMNASSRGTAVAWHNISSVLGKSPPFGLMNKPWR